MNTNLDITSFNFLVQAARKGTSLTLVGLIFGIFELVSFLASPIFGNYVRNFSIYILVYLVL